MRWLVPAMLLVSLLLPASSSRAQDVPSCGEDFSQCCPPGSTPVVSDVSFEICSDGEPESGTCVETDELTNCSIFCQNQDPCRCGGNRASFVTVEPDGSLVTGFRFDCDLCPACGDGECTAVESHESCPADCGPICEAGDVRCNGSRLERCLPDGRWSFSPCPEVDQWCHQRPGQQPTCLHCDPTDPPEWFQDFDGDGRGSLMGQRFVGCFPPPGWVLNASDCDDTQFDGPTDPSCLPLEPDEGCDFGTSRCSPEGDREVCIGSGFTTLPCDDPTSCVETGLDTTTCSECFPSCDPFACNVDDGCGGTCECEDPAAICAANRCQIIN